MHLEKKKKVHKVDVTLDELFSGCIKKVRFNIKLHCKCFEQSFVKCDECNGKGRVLIRRQVGPSMFQQFEHRCDYCNGSGKKRNKDIKCSSCNNTGFINDNIELTYFIQAGSVNGQHKIFENSGSQDLDGDREDIVLVINELPHKYFKRKNSHLLYHKTLNLAESLIGPKFIIEYFNGEKIYVNDETIVNNNSYHKIENKGMPIPEYTGIYGDLFIVYDIEYPEKINKDHKNYIFKILNQKRQKLKYKVEDCNVYNTQHLKNLTENDFSSKINNDSSDDEDNPGNVQCAQQ